MRWHNGFNLNRLSHLILNDLRSHTKIIFTLTITFIVFFALMPFHLSTSKEFYYFLLFLGGFIITSFAFNDYHDPKKAISTMMIPCSTFERFLNKWVLTSIVYSIALLFLFYVLSLISYAFNYFIYHQPIYIINLFDSGLWINTGKYILLQSIVLLGAISFRRYALIKTALVIGLFTLLLDLLSFIITWIICPHCILHQSTIHISMQENGILFWFFTAPICWFITYLKLSELEIK